MRTSLDIPDPLFRELKVAAASHGETLRSFLLRAARKELAGPSEAPKRRVSFPLVQSRELAYDLSPVRLNEILEAEDRELAAGH
jgi:hypothetical protein